MNMHAAALAEAHLSRRTDLGVRPRCDRRPVAAAQAAVAEIFLRRRPVRNCSKQITRLPEYYPTRTELSILRDRGREICRHHPEGRGAGRIRRRRHHQGPAAAGRMRLRRLRSRGYFRRFPQSAGRRAAQGFPRRSTSIRWRRILPRRSRCPKRSPAMPKVGFFPGSTLGNFEPHEACAFLRSARDDPGRRARR